MKKNELESALDELSYAAENVEFEASRLAATAESLLRELQQDGIEND